MLVMLHNVTIDDDEGNDDDDNMDEGGHVNDGDFQDRILIRI